jgi:Protein of unknown function (DUF3237)
MDARPPLALPSLRTRVVCRVDASLEPPLEWAPTAAGQRRVIGIAGGTFDGPLMSGEILPGGADWQILAPDDTAIVEARYTLRTRDGELILVNSRGVRTGPPDVLAALRRGEMREPDDYYFRTAVTLETGPGDYEWVNRALFVAVAARGPASVVYDLHQIL